MAPLTFPNEKQMVSSEESGPAAAWGGGCGGLGFWGAVRGAWGASAPCKRQVRGETTRSLFRGWGFFVVFSLMRGGSEDSFLFKMWGALFSREPRGAAARRRVRPALGERGVKRPPGPAPSASPGGGHQDLARPTTGACLLVPGGGGLPHTPLPPAPPLWGNFPTKGRRERCVSGLEISCRSAAGKQKDFTEQKTAGGDLMLPPIFLNEITPN